MGHFRGVRSLPIRPGADPIVAGQLERVDVKIDEDGKTVVEDGGIPYEGHAHRDGDRMIVEIDNVSGISIDRQDNAIPRTLEFRLESDGTLRYGPVRLSRMPAKP